MKCQISYTITGYQKGGCFFKKLRDFSKINIQTFLKNFLIQNTSTFSQRPDFFLPHETKSYDKIHETIVFTYQAPGSTGSLRNGKQMRWDHHCPIWPFGESFQPAASLKLPSCRLNLKRQNKKPRRGHTSRVHKTGNREGRESCRERVLWNVVSWVQINYHMCVRKPHKGAEGTISETDLGVHVPISHGVKLYGHQVEYSKGYFTTKA